MSISSLEHKSFSTKLIISGSIGGKKITKIIFPTVPVNKEYIETNLREPNINWKLTTINDIYHITEVKNKEGIWKTESIKMVYKNKL